MNLPNIYTEEQWKRGGSIEAHKKHIGKPYLSWSAVELWRDEKAFGTKPEFSHLTGRMGYITKYLFKDKSYIVDSMADFGQFGHQTESCICERVDCEAFSKEELKVLHGIEPLGVFQREILMPFKGFVLLGYIDDMTPSDEKGVVKLVRDYKTKSKSSKKDLHKPDKLQLDLYIAALEKEGLKVESAEYCIIERLGGRECMQGHGRSSLTVGKEVWYEPYAFSKKSMDRAKRLVREAASEIAEYYTVFQLLTKN